MKKLIIDVRDNGGGDVIDMRDFVERFISKEALVGYQRTKEGNGRFNYTPWVPMYVKPHPFAIPNPIPIVVLADYGSVSMAEMTTMALKSQEMVKFVGDYTHGGTAALGPGDELNGGALNITVANRLKFYMPLMATKDASGKVIEGIGVEPDVYVAPPTQEERQDMKVNANHKDRAMEKAVEELMKM
ncbi:S41 family peptidase [Galbibacter pacificus]